MYSLLFVNKSYLKMENYIKSESLLAITLMEQKWKHWENQQAMLM